MKLRHALRGTAAGLLLAVCLTTPTLALTGVVDVGQHPACAEISQHYRHCA